EAGGLCLGAQVIRNPEASEHLLDRDLGDAHGRVVHGSRLLDHRPRARANPVGVGEHPQQHAGIEQDQRRTSRASSHIAATSSSAAANASSSMVIFPARVPKEMSGRTIGRNSAIGRPALAMTIRSPAWARSSSRERCVLASWMFTVAMHPEYPTSP